MDIETGESSTCASLQSLAASIRAELIIKTQDDILPKRSIFRVPKLLRDANEDAYTPNFVSIGPYHHKDGRFLSAEDYKLGFLKTFLSHAALDTQQKKDLESFLDIIKKEETNIRGYYADPFNLSSDEFIRMVLIDGAFIIEFLQKYCRPPHHNIDNDNEQLSGQDRIHEVVRDMLLLENQLPLFILDYLCFHAYGESISIPKLVSTMVYDFLHLGIQPLVDTQNPNDAHPHYHLLHLVWRLSIPCPFPTENKGRKLNVRSHTAGEDSTTSVFKLKSTASLTATRLHEAGVKFKMVDSSPSVEGDLGMFGIHFDENKTTLRFPRLRLMEDPMILSLLRNLVALEQCMYLYKSPTYFTDYHYFLDCLINTPQDVQLLADAGLVENCSLGCEVLCDMFNTISKNTRFASQTYFYAGLSEQLNKHATPWNHHIATFKHKYFKHPWSAISVVAAIVVIVFTLIQVITGILAVVDVSLADTFPFSVIFRARA